MSSKTLQLVETNHALRQGTGFRKHLGASIVGRDCARELWYIFRWARRSSFQSRILRLFDRGNREEVILLQLLRRSGIHAVDINPVTGRQYRIEDHDGHFGGSFDAQLFDTPDFPGIWVLGEFKTHNEKSFRALQSKGLEKSKPEHVVQMQIYMHYGALTWALYFAVNKNDDHILVIPVEYDRYAAEKAIERARKIIFAKSPPVRISESPGWYRCKWCDYSVVCHDHRPKAMNCRTCINARPIHDAQWHCKEFDVILDEAAQHVGCQQYHEIPDE